MPFQVLSFGSHGERVIFTSKQASASPLVQVNAPEKMNLVLTPSVGKRLKEIVIETLWNLEGLYPAFVFSFADNPFFSLNLPLPTNISAQLADPNITNGLLFNTDFANSPTRRIRLALTDCANLVLYNVGDPTTPSQVIFDFVME